MADEPADAPLLALRRLASGLTEWSFAGRVCTDHLGVAIKLIPGRGFGVLANRRFAAGERVIAERPLIHWHTRSPYESAHDFSELTDCGRKSVERVQFL